MPYTTLVSGTVITASWANASVRDQVVTPHATAAARASAVTAPVEGMLSYRVDGKMFEGYDGSAWRTVPLVTWARKLVDESVNNTAALQSDDILLWPVAANGIYWLDLHVLYNTAATPDIKVGWTFPAGLTMLWSVIGLDTSLVASAGSAGTESTTASLGGNAADVWMHLTALVTTSGTAGNLVLQWAQNTATVGNTIVRAGSFGSLTRVG